MHRLAGSPDEQEPAGHHAAGVCGDDCHAVVACGNRETRKQVQPLLAQQRGLRTSDLGTNAGGPCACGTRESPRTDSEKQETPDGPAACCPAVPLIPPGPGATPAAGPKCCA